MKIVIYLVTLFVLLPAALQYAQLKDMRKVQKHIDVKQTYKNKQQGRRAKKVDTKNQRMRVEEQDRDGSEVYDEMSRKALEREEKVRQMSRRYMKDLQVAVNQVSSAQKEAIQIASGVTNNKQTIDFTSQENKPLKDEAERVSARFCEMFQRESGQQAGNVAKCAQQTLDTVKQGLQFVDQTFSAVSSLTNEINSFMAQPGISGLVASFGPIGIGINLGVKFINALTVIADKGLVNGIKSLMAAPSDSQKQLNELFNIQNQISSLGEQITNLLDKLSQQLDMNSAKQNIFQSVEVLLHMNNMLQFQNSQCNDQIQENDMTGQKTDKPGCLLAKKKFLQMGHNMNFAYHINQIFKMYSGDINLLGMDYFAQLSKMNHGNQALLNQHYQYFQQLISQSVTAYFVYNQLYARDVFENEFAQLRLNLRDALRNKEQNVLTDNDYELVLNMLTTTCEECVELNQDHKRQLLIGDLLFCSRVPDYCKMDDMKKSLLTQSITKEEEAKIQQNEVNPTKLFNELFAKYSKTAKTPYSLANSVETALPKTFSNHFASMAFMNTFVDGRSSSPDSFYILSYNTKSIDYDKDSNCVQQIQSKQGNTNIYYYLIWKRETTFDTKYHKGIIKAVSKFFKGYYAKHTDIFLTNRLTCQDDLLDQIKGDVMNLNMRSFIMQCHSEYFDMEGDNTQTSMYDFYKKVPNSQVKETTTERIPDAVLNYWQYQNGVSFSIDTHQKPKKMFLNVMFTANRS